MPSINPDALNLKMMESRLEDSLEFNLTRFGDDLIEVFNLKTIWD